MKEAIRKLESLGVFIHLSYDHYKDGSNCSFSIEFTKQEAYPEKHLQTGWYGDNHEFGDTADCIECAIRFANWLLEDSNLYWYFYNVKETVTKEGHANFIKYLDFKELSDNKIYTEFNNARQ